jgi:hypothetical protein
VRRRYGPDVDGWSGVDIASFDFVVLFVVGDVFVWYRCVVLWWLLLRAFFIFFPCWCGVSMSVHVGAMARFLPAATVGFIPTVFVG